MHAFRIYSARPRLSVPIPPWLTMGETPRYLLRLFSPIASFVSYRKLDPWLVSVNFCRTGGMVNYTKCHQVVACRSCKFTPDSKRACHYEGLSPKPEHHNFNLNLTWKAECPEKAACSRDIRNRFACIGTQ
ncbi:hypothetical protein LY76DRAFT_167894 [Colletotrichum caudatum]|nr:hypothetical protein LY76DRAFT_167894 [Colletotrichum caudatum]